MSKSNDLFRIFVKLFPNFASDIKSYKEGKEKNQIILLRKGPAIRPYYVFTYNSDKDWTLVFF